MTTPRSAVAWIGVVVAAAVVAVVASLASGDSGGLDPAVAATLVAGVAASSLLPVRYRIGASTHALTADEAFLVAMLVSLPSAWVPLLLGVGVVLGNVLRLPANRVPTIRVVFNFGLVSLAGSLARSVHAAGVHPDGPFEPRSIAAVAVAIVVYAVAAGLIIAMLFSRLGLATFRDALADAWPVNRLTVPASLLGGLGLGWLANQGLGFAVAGVLFSIAMFASFRTSVGARQQRERAARLRDVATSLVTASGSLDAFDEALRRIAEIFGAARCELHLADGGLHVATVDSMTAPTSDPSKAAELGLGLSRATTLEAGSEHGGPDGALVAPIVRQGTNIGALVLHGRRGLEPWDDADEDVLDGIAGEVHVALQNAELVEALEAERARLASQSDLLEGILSAASDGIALIGSDGEVLTWNPAMSAIAGTGEQDVIGRPWTEVLRAESDDERAGDPLVALRAALAGTTLARTWRIRPVAGEARFVRVVLSPASAGEHDAVVLLARDVTAAREVDRLKSDFIATVSHELRTPLTPIKGFIELDGRGALSAERRPEMLDLIRRQVQRLEALIDDLLAMAQLDRDLVDVVQEPVELREVVTRVHAMHVETGRIMPHSEPVTVVGDAEAIARIVDAMVDNALKHTEGAVQLTIGRRGGSGLVTVVDTGPGIAHGDHEIIFERFSRLGDHLLRTQGPGLGLPIARALARRLGGDVTVSSELGQGATFELSLPLA